MAMSTLLPVDMRAVSRSLVLDPPLTDAELEALCRANDNVQFERTREGVIHMNPPAGLFTGDGNAEIIHQLRSWWNTHLKGRATIPTPDSICPMGRCFAQTRRMYRQRH